MDVTVSDAFDPSAQAEAELLRPTLREDQDLVTLCKELGEELVEQQHLARSVDQIFVYCFDAGIWIYRPIKQPGLWKNSD